MRLLLLVPGTGTFVCGSCLRDNVLARSLRALGHDKITRGEPANDGHIRAIR